MSDAVQQEQQQQRGHRYDQQVVARGQIGSILSAYIRVVPSEDHSDVFSHAVAVVSSVCPCGWSVGARSATGFCLGPIEVPDLKLKRAGPRSRWRSSAYRKFCINEHGSGDINLWSSDTSRN